MRNPCFRGIATFSPQRGHPRPPFRPSNLARFRQASTTYGGYTFVLRHYNRSCQSFSTDISSDDLFYISNYGATSRISFSCSKTRSARHQGPSACDRTWGGDNLKNLNLSTYKYHALADYPDMIREYGTTDSYSTQTV